MIRNLVLLSIFMLSTLVYSQNKINGIVEDHHSSEKLLGVNIILLGSSNGTTAILGEDSTGDTASWKGEIDEMGIWKSENVKTLDEMGLAKLVEGQF